MSAKIEDIINLEVDNAPVNFSSSIRFNKQELNSVDKTLRSEKDAKQSYLLDGTTFTLRLKQLIDPTITSYTKTITNITEIRFAQDRETPAGATTTTLNANQIPAEITGGAPRPAAPVIAWIEGTIIYIKSEANTIYANIDSSHLIQNFTSMQVLDLHWLKTTYTTNMTEWVRQLGYNSATDEVEILGLNSLDFSKVVDGTNLFQNLRNMSWPYGMNWNFESMTAATNMFDGCENLAPWIFDTWTFYMPKCTNTRYMFQNTGIETFDASKFVLNPTEQINPGYMLINTPNLSKVDLRGWAGLTIRYLSFLTTYSDALIQFDLRGWSQSQISNSWAYFWRYNANLETIYVDENWGQPPHYATNPAIGDCPKLKGGFGHTVRDCSGSSTAYSEYLRADTITTPGVFTLRTSKPAILKSGQEFNTALKSLVAGGTKPFTDRDHLISSIEWVEKEHPSSSQPYIELQEGDSTPIYAWAVFQNDNTYKIKLITMAETVYVNKNADYMFYNFGLLNNLDMSRFDFSQVENMQNMFADTNGLSELTGLDTMDVSKCKFMDSLFASSHISQSSIDDLSNWNTASLQTVESAFAYTDNFTRLHLAWDFTHCSSFNFLVQDTGSLVSVDFIGCKPTLVEDTEFVEFAIGSNASYFNLAALKAIPGNIDSMFYTSKAKLINLTGWKADDIYCLSHTFARANQLTTIYIGEEWQLPNDPDLDIFETFYNTPNLVGGNGTVNHDYDGSYARADIDGQPGLFTLNQGSVFPSGLTIRTKIGSVPNEVITDIVFTNDLSNVPDNAQEVQASGIPVYLYHSDDGKIVTFASFSEQVRTSAAANSLFYRLPNLKHIDIDWLDTSNTTSISNIFDGDSSLTKIDISNWNLNRCTSMTGLFKDTTALQELILCPATFNRVPTMADFLRNSGLKHIDFRPWSIVSTIATSSVSFNYAFAGSALIEVDLSPLAVTLEADLTLNLKNMCQNALNLQAINLKGIQGGKWTTNYIAQNAANLRSIYVDPKTGDSVSGSNSDFQGCNKLVGANGSTIAKLGTNGKLLQLDTPDNPGLGTKFFWEEL